MSVDAEASPIGRGYSVGDDSSIHADAAAKGCVVVTPAANELLIDIDNEADMQVFNKNVEILKRHANVDFRVQPSKSGGEKRHVYLTVAGEYFTPLERVALQAMLGSDRTREILGYIRIEQGRSKHPTVFFEKLP